MLRGCNILHMNLYTAEQVAEKTGKTRQAVTRWAQRNPGVGRKYSGVWLFTEDDVKRIAGLRRGPKRKPKKRKTAAGTEQPAGGNDETDN